ncbi:MAG TPA: sulfotransferase family 2 domain-containing protein [Rhizomicrobium sp.]|jgi:hypothetical protein|nr:sulfotransferase family 2 domain-containing protein [Rhizomicrobium sp.]
MIVSDTHKMVFVHVPKCAGTTVIRHLSAYDCFPRDFKAHFCHPKLGLVNFYHLPLDILRAHFPVQFVKLRTYESYAIVREPRRRFSSALFHYLLEFRNHGQMTRDALPWLRQEAEAVCEVLNMPGGPERYEYTFFQKQVRFIRLDGERLVENLFSFENLPHFATALKERHGITLDLGEYHNRRYLKHHGMLDAAIRAARPVYGRVLPTTWRYGLGALFHDLMRDSPEPVHRQLFADGALCRFVDAHYSEDREIYQSLGGGQA